ncbi:MAG: isochorismatase family cysteine hydrolase [Pseudomonadota bacterium]
MRNKKLVAKKTAVLVVDVQRLETQPSYVADKPYFAERVNQLVLPNIKSILNSARNTGAEVIYTVIESLTADGRDRSLDHKLSDVHVPKGSVLGEVIEDVAPINDEIVLKKTSSGVFNSTNLDYVLRNLGVENLIVVGLLTDQCVDMAVRDGADRGYYVLCVTDACATHSAERHTAALNAFSGYCELLASNEVGPRLATDNK